MGTIDTMQDDVCREAGAVRRRFAGWSVLDALHAGWRWLDGRIDKRRSRIALSELTDDQLRDIGLTRRQANEEVYRSFWD